VLLYGDFSNFVVSQRIGSSVSKANAEKGIEAIKTHAPNAAVEKHSG
jgi:Domain of unknown function (DUF1508)